MVFSKHLHSIAFQLNTAQIATYISPEVRSQLVEGSLFSLLVYAGYKLQFKQLLSIVIADNTASLRATEYLFDRVGTLDRGLFLKGKYRDAVLFHLRYGFSKWEQESFKYAVKYMTPEIEEYLESALKNRYGDREIESVGAVPPCLPLL